MKKENKLMLGVFSITMAGGIIFFIQAEIGIWHTFLFYFSLLLMQIGAILLRPYQVRLKDLRGMKITDRFKHLFDVEDKE